MIYSWGKARVPGIAAQVAGEELERIRVAHNGQLEPSAIVNASRPESAPLHVAFEWDDAIAAEEHRKAQAAYIIRHIDVVIADDETPKSTRAFVSIVRDDHRSYTSVAHAMADEDLRQQVLSEALSQLQAWRRRYADLVELAEVVEAADRLIAA